MARPRNRENSGLPQNLLCRKRKRSNGKIVHYYFYVLADGKEKSLGTDKNTAILETAKLNLKRKMTINTFTFVDIAQRYSVEILPGNAHSTQKAKQTAIKYLTLFFGDPPFTLEQITPKHIKMYLDWRKDLPKSANNEVRVFNHIWNMAREWGYTTAFSPAMGVKKHKTENRDVYIEDYILEKFKAFANQDMRDLIDIAYLTGQRPIDIVNIHKSQIFDDILHITQQKTKAKVRIKLVGRLADIIKRRMNTTDKNYLFSNKRNGKFSRNLLSRQFAKLRETVIKAYPEIEDELKNIQFRDLRAKAATDQYLEKDEETAQKQLGHTSSTMTKRYIRKDKIVMPTK